MNLLFKFTLGNSIEGDLEIKEPEGWDDGLLKLERNKDYHSLVEYYAQPLTFDDAQCSDLVTQAVLVGGLAYIKNVEATQGPDAIITLEIELSEDNGYTYETCFNGVLDFDTLKEIDFYKLECGVKRDDFWSKFINRKAIPVDLESITDLDGNARDAVPGFTLSLPSQILRKRFDGSPLSGFALWDSAFGSGDYIQIDFDNTVLSEIDTKFNIPSGGNDAIPVSLFSMAEQGSYTFDVRIEVSLKQRAGLPSSCSSSIWVTDPTDSFLRLWFIHNGVAYQFTETEITGLSTVYTYTNTLDLVVGDEIGIYGTIDNDTWKTANTYDNILIWGTDNSQVLVRMGTFFFNGSVCTVDVESFELHNFGTAPSTEAIPSYMTITANTITPDTETDAYILKDAAESILSKLIGQDDVVESDYMTTGCGELFAVMKGLHVRGYAFADKPLFMTFDQWWNGANPIFNLGLGYETTIGSPEFKKIRIEQKEFFYDKTSTSFDLDFVNNIERSYAQEYIFKSIESGYNKWSAESASGVDDPQSKRTWRTKFATIGKDEKILSDFIGASLAIEQTRRNRVELGKDWRLDEDIMIIALNDSNEPEFDENFAAITNLLNSDARYNIRLSVARNFQRWLDFFRGCLQIPSGLELYFASGEGNSDMTSQLNEDDCEAVAGTEPVITENGDWSVNDDFLFMPVVYEFEHPLRFDEYKLIRDNPTKAIGVSRTGTGHKKCFIMNLDYKPTHGLGTFTVLLGENDPII